MYDSVLPFKTRPVLDWWLVSLSLSLVVWLFCSSPSSCFSFSPLQALGKHKPRCGLWFPLCCPGHAPLHRPVPRAPLVPLGHRPAVLLLVCFRCRRLAFSLSLSLSLWFRSPADCMQTRVYTRGWPTRRRPQLSSRLFLGCFGGRASDSVPDSLSRTVGAPPIPSRSPLKQGPEEGMGEATVLSHKCVR